MAPGSVSVHECLITVSLDVDGRRGAGVGDDAKGGRSMIA
jgi:hypothetical protein